MRINITARRFQLKDEIRTFAENEMQRLEKYYDGILDVEIILSWEKFYRLAEIKTKLFGNLLHSKERAEEMTKAIRLAVDKLERQLVKQIDKKHDHHHEKAVVMAEEAGTEEFDEYDEEF